MGKTRVVVTGLGASTPLGGDVASTWDGLLAGKSGIRTLPWDNLDAFPVQFAAQAAVEPADTGLLAKPQMRRMDRCQQFALIAAIEAMKHAGYAHKDTPGETVDPDRLGVVLSSGIGGLHSALDSYDVFREKGWRRVSPFTVPMLMPNGSAAHVGLEFNATAGIHALVSACSSSAEAVGYAIDMIRSGRADVVIAGGTEACIHPLQMASFGAMRAMSTRNDAPELASRPYDKARDGFVLGEGSAVLILESEEYARARGARIHAYASGVGYSADGHDMVQPPEDGRGAAKAMQRCLKDAELEPEQIVHINAHGTSTPLGDVAELNGIKGALGEHARKINITATKSMTGHLLGGAGALESLITVLSLREGLVPAVANLENLDDQVDLDIVMGEPRKLPDGPAAALNNSFGFGGHNVTLAFERAL
ncbi:beta-ketoacyl-[acyl-carrier-protein] synthase family protein [Actinocorallia populi]|uniref:beta-ketoacyl-[acyl-carrier-protein] synthase family protein n=1 Tax=Actinocorallia populi TaxID=2079200 RepID=UPI000D0977EB|nr:beta-ketoacyl-[acyl-carrier-protein] synthase family protein [Actinocorallia populi]